MYRVIYLLIYLFIYLFIYLSMAIFNSYVKLPEDTVDGCELHRLMVDLGGAGFLPSGPEQTEGLKAQESRKSFNYGP